ncbi:thiamine pyrophosphate-dependent enzyme [Nocardia gipuzkoensis]
MLGSMGMAVPFSLGIALATEKTVIAIEGDGGCLMNLGTLGTVARYAPANLAVVILDNASYGSTGGQSSATADGVNLSAVARACGIQNVARFSTSPAEIVEWIRQPGPRIAVVDTAPDCATEAFVSLQPSAIARRLESFLRQEP